MSNRESHLVKRIELIKKKYTFFDLLARFLPSEKIPTQSTLIKCLMPEHNDNTPSMGVRKQFFKCFGCQKGGDIFDFICHYRKVELPKALQIMESLLGFNGQNEDTDLENLITMSRIEKNVEIKHGEWRDQVMEVEEEFLKFALPYMRCRDPLVYGLAVGPVETIYTEFDHIRMNVPKTLRGRREALYGLRRFARTYISMIHTETLRVTGKDLLDISSQNCGTTIES